MGAFNKHEEIYGKTISASNSSLQQRIVMHKSVKKSYPSHSPSLVQVTAHHIRVVNYGFYLALNITIRKLCSHIIP